MEVMLVCGNTFFAAPQIDVDYLALGLFFVEKKQDSKALDAFEAYMKKNEPPKREAISKLHSALSKIESRSKNKPLSARCNILQAELLLKSDSLSAAITRYKQAFVKIPENAGLPFRIGQIYDVILDRKTSIKHYESAIEVAKKYPTGENKKVSVKAVEARERNLKIIERYDRIK